MADTLRVRSNAYGPFVAREPLPEQYRDKPGDAPALRSFVIQPGVNTFSGDDIKAYRAWANAKPSFVTDGIVSELQGDEPEMEFGWEPALAAASNADTAGGSTITEPGPVPATEMRPAPLVSPDDGVRGLTPSAMPAAANVPVPSVVPAAPIAPVATTKPATAK